MNQQRVALYQAQALEAAVQPRKSIRQQSNVELERNFGLQPQQPLLRKRASRGAFCSKAFPPHCCSSTALADSRDNASAPLLSKFWQ
jgi:hypothetical protein